MEQFSYVKLGDNLMRIYRKLPWQLKTCLGFMEDKEYGIKTFSVFP